MGRRLTKAQQEAADAAYLRQLQEEMPLDVQPATPAYPFHERVPTECPGCHKAMTCASGWALVFGDVLQCGACGHAIEVPRAEYERFGKLLHEHFAKQSWDRPAPTRGPRTRGAG